MHIFDNISQGLSYSGFFNTICLSERVVPWATLSWQHYNITRINWEWFSYHVFFEYSVGHT